MDGILRGGGASRKDSSVLTVSPTLQATPEQVLPIQGKQRVEHIKAREKALSPYTFVSSSSYNAHFTVQPVPVEITTIKRVVNTQH